MHSIRKISSEAACVDTQKLMKNKNYSKTSGFFPHPNKHDYELDYLLLDRFTSCEHKSYLQSAERGTI